MRAAEDLQSLAAKLRRVLRRKGRSHDEADDLIQEAFLRLHVYCRAHAIRNTGGFLFRTALNLAFDRTRRERVAAVVPGGLDELPLVDPYPLPDEVCAGQERLQRMRAGLDGFDRPPHRGIRCCRAPGRPFPAPLHD